MRKIKKEKGITLVALVVTIIVILILAGIAIGLILGEKGIIGRASKAKEEYEKAREDEEERLANLYSSIKIADNEDSEITINMKELKTIIKSTLAEEMSKGADGINNNSVLMISKDEDRSISERTLKDFTNTFTEEVFEKYFEYNSAIGELICKQEGWYSIGIQINLQNTVSNWTTTVFKGFVNEKEVTSVTAASASGSAVNYNSNSTTVYLKENDKITFIKTTQNNPPNNYNEATIRIIKI